MSKTNGSEHAFPHLHINNGTVKLEGGITKREYFAHNAPILELLKLYHDRPCGTLEECAALAVHYADALIEELNKERANESI